MDLVVVAMMLSTVPAATAWSSSPDNPDAPFIKAGITPECPADLFDAELVIASCHQGEVLGWTT